MTGHPARQADAPLGGLAREDNGRSALGPGIAGRANEDLAAQPPEYQRAVRAGFRSRFDALSTVLVSRRCRDAEHHAHAFVSAVNAIRMQHGDSVDAASECLDRFVLSARSAVESAPIDGDGHAWTRPETGSGEVGKEPWHEAAQSLVQTFQLNQRAFDAGRLAREDFFRGSEVLVTKLLSQIRDRVGAPQNLDFWQPGERLPGRQEVWAALGQEAP